MVGWIILIDRPNDHGSGGGNGELPRQVVASNPGNGVARRLRFQSIGLTCFRSRLGPKKWRRLRRFFYFAPHFADFYRGRISRRSPPIIIIFFLAATTSTLTSCNETLSPSLFLPSRLTAMERSSSSNSNNKLAVNQNKSSQEPNLFFSLSFPQSTCKQYFFCVRLLKENLLCACQRSVCEAHSSSRL